MRLRLELRNPFAFCGPGCVLCMLSSHFRFFACASMLQLRCDKKQTLHLGTFLSVAHITELRRWLWTFKPFIKTKSACRFSCQDLTAAVLLLCICTLTTFWKCGSNSSTGTYANSFTSATNEFERVDVVKKIFVFRTELVPRNQLTTSTPHPFCTLASIP